MKEILSCSYLCFCSAKLRFFKLCKFSFWKGKPLFYRFLWYYRFFCFLLFAIFSAFLHRSFGSKSPFSSEKSHHARQARLNSFASRSVVPEDIQTFKARECLASGGGGVSGFIRLNIRLNSSEYPLKQKYLCSLSARQDFYHYFCAISKGFNK